MRDTREHETLLHQILPSLTTCMMHTSSLSQIRRQLNLHVCRCSIARISCTAAWGVPGLQKFKRALRISTLILCCCCRARPPVFWGPQQS